MAVMSGILVLLCFRSLKQGEVESRNLFIFIENYVPGTELSHENTAVNKADVFPALLDHK